MQDIEFENRAVAFIDVLGFKSVVDVAAQDGNKLCELKELIGVLESTVHFIHFGVRSRLIAYLLLCLRFFCIVLVKSQKTVVCPLLLVTRTSGGVGGKGREASSYPDWAFSWLAAKLGAWHLLFSVKGHFAFSFFHAKNREYTFMLLIPMVKPNFGWSQKLSWH